MYTLLEFNRIRSIRGKMHWQVLAIIAKTLNVNGKWFQRNSNLFGWVFFGRTGQLDAKRAYVSQRRWKLLGRAADAHFLIPVGLSYLWPAQFRAPVVPLKHKLFSVFFLHFATQCTAYFIFFMFAFIHWTLLLFYAAHGRNKSMMIMMTMTITLQ